MTMEPNDTAKHECPAWAAVKAIDTESRQITAIASTRERDRDEDIILPEAFRAHLTAFLKNPVILAGHQHRSASGSPTVIGSVVPGSLKIGDGAVTFTMRFASTALGEEYWQLYRDGHMRAFSIGFIPLAWESDDTARNRWGGPLRTYTEIELLEISAVAVPSNRSALAIAAAFGDDAETRRFTDALLAALLPRLREAVAADTEKFLDSIRTELIEIKDLLIPDANGLAEAAVLGAADDRSGRCEDDPAERQLKRIRTALSGTLQ